MVLPPQVFVIPVVSVRHLKENEAAITYEKQANGDSLNAVDRFVTGERITTTAFHGIKGTEDRSVPTAEERAEMTTGRRMKEGETLRHIGFDKLKQRKESKQDAAWLKQEQGDEDLTIMDQIRMGQRPLVLCCSRNTGKHIATPEERKEMSTNDRLKSGETGRNIFKEKKLTIRKHRAASEEGNSLCSDASVVCSTE